MGRTAHGGAFAIAAATIFVVLTPSHAVAGDFAVGNCKADQLHYNTRAFVAFAHRGMKVRRACAPNGPGLRGLITANVARSGRVPRGSVALLTMDAPAGTQFTQFNWGGFVKRTDCRYALQLWADAPDGKAVPMKNVRANQHCPPPRRVQGVGYPVEQFDVTGTTRIVQRVICMGDAQRKSCSARGSNYILTEEAEVRIADVSPPAATINGDTPLARGDWVRGDQPLNYDASDNVGVRQGRCDRIGEVWWVRPAALRVRGSRSGLRRAVPCSNGAGRINVRTTQLPEGTQSLVVRAQDTAGNVGDSPPVTARIDNTPPGRVDVGVEGGEAWRNRNDFAVGWTNPEEPDRAPIAAVSYKLCGADGTCTGGEASGEAIDRLALPVPAPGEWTLSLWRRDAAGNQTETAASVPVTLRYDPDPPALGFEPLSATDPTLVTVSVTDAVSGLAGGAIEISQSGSGTWQALPTEKAGSKLVARIDDAALPAGTYQLRARAADQAGNEASTDVQLDGRVMGVTLPLRRAAALRAGFERVRVVRRTVRRHGKRRVVRRRTRVRVGTTRVRVAATR